MDVRQLKYFLAVVDHRNVGRAAAHLNISQPALSKCIRRLEEDLDVKLFDRTPDGMIPNVFGLALAERARLITIEMRSALQELSALRGLHRGSVVVGTGPSAAGEILARAIQRLNLRRPELQVTVLEGLQDMQLSELRKGYVDLVVGTFLLDAADHDIQWELLFRDQVSVVARAKHPLATKTRLSLPDLCEYPWVLPMSSDAVRRHLDQIFTAAGLTPPQPSSVTNSVRFMLGLVMAGDALTYLPRVLTRIEEEVGLLAAIDVPGTQWQREVQLARRVKGTLHPAGRALVAEMKQVCLETQGALLPLRRASAPGIRTGQS